MGRTHGAKDKKPRKKRKFYAGRRIKRKRKVNGILIPYKPKRNPTDPVKLWFWKIQKMDINSSRNFSKKTRSYMRKIVYGKGVLNRIRVDVEPSRLRNRESVEQLCLELLWEGDWLIKMWGHAKNKFHTTSRPVATVKITRHPEGMKAKVTPSYKNRGLYRYWFWEGN